jgi:hypothetical protein
MIDRDHATPQQAAGNDFLDHASYLKQELAMEVALDLSPCHDITLDALLHSHFYSLVNISGPHPDFFFFPIPVGTKFPPVTASLVGQGGVVTQSGRGGGDDLFHLGMVEDDVHLLFCKAWHTFFAGQALFPIGFLWGYLHQIAIRPVYV